MSLDLICFPQKSQNFTEAFAAFNLCISVGSVGDFIAFLSVKSLGESHPSDEGDHQTISYTNQREILEALSLILADVNTSAFLGELFFEFLASEVRTTTPSEDRLKLYINTRHEIHELYAIARAGKVLQVKARRK